ncbi:MAG: orotate phosphoribosyltransferase [Cyclobacteriaceae bacterium]
MSVVIVNPKTAAAVASSLLEIGAIKLSHQKPFTWSSGWKSPVYCDNRLSLSYPRVRDFIRDALTATVRQHFADAQYIAGVATAGVPQGALVADQLSLPYVYVRPKPKDHGMENLIEGKVDPGKKVVLVEDLISTGGSSIKAAQALRDAKFEVIGMVAIFTYGFDTATTNFEAAKIPLICLSDFNSLLPEAIKQNFMSEADLAYVQNWRKDPANWK